MAISGYDPDYIPVSVDAPRAYDDETGILTPGLQDQPMDEEEFRSRVRQSIEDAAVYIDTYIAPEREAAMSYYLGNSFGNEEEGSSQVVLTEVRDTILAMLPSLLRIFTGGDKVLEFVPKTAEDVEVAEQQTDFINYIFMQENPGFRILHDAMKDALILKEGVLTWYKRDEETVEEYSYSGLSQEEAALIAQDPSVTVLEYREEQSMMQRDNVVTMTPDVMMMPQMISMRIKRVIREPRYVVECIPVEQFIIDNQATCIEDALIVGRRKLATVSELVAMGYDKDLVEMNAGSGGFELNMETLVRNPADQSFFGIANGNDESTDKVYYVEAYIRIDKDGDGIAELHKVCTVGNGGYIVHQEIVTEAPFSLLSPDPTPHTIFGKSIADQTMDLQLIKSSIMRNTLDSLAQSIRPRTLAVEGQVNMDDLLNNEIGAVIRARNPGAVVPFSTPFVGQPALGVMAYVDEIKTQRTGISRASQGLDAEALQSTTRAAVQAQLSSSQERIEMIARLFADGLKRCFKGLLHLVTQHQDKPKIIRLRNKFVPIDPRGWTADMDMIVNIALGRGSDEQRMMFLQQIAAKQEQILQQYGPNNPMVSIQQYVSTLNQITQLAGFQNPAQFYSEPTPEQVQQFMQSMAPEKKQDPAEMLAQVEAEKTRADILIAAAKQELETKKAQADADLKRDQLIADVMLRAAEIQAKYGSQVDVATINAEVNRQRAEIEAMFNLQSQREQAILQQPAPQPMMPQGMMYG
jgi:uncharacterized protein (UPF0254 family)